MRTAIIAKRNAPQPEWINIIDRIVSDKIIKIQSPAFADWIALNPLL